MSNRLKSWPALAGLGAFLLLARRAPAGPTPEQAAQTAQAVHVLALSVGVLLATFSVIALVLILKAAAIALAIAASEIAPRPFRRGRDLFGLSPVKAFFVGLVNFLFAAFVAGLLLRNLPAGALGALFLGILFLLFYYYAGRSRLLSGRGLLVIVGLVLFVGFASGRDKGAAGWLVLIALAVLLTASRAVAYQWLGVRLVGEIVDPDRLSSLRARLWGGAVTELALLLPLVVPGFLVAMTAFGALLLALLSGRRAVVPAAETAHPPVGPPEAPPA
jgi:hypothetical protein